MEQLKVLIACEESQVICTCFRDVGCEAYSCDLQECSGGHPEWHIHGDCLPLFNGKCEFITQDGNKHKIDTEWDLIIFHPPCTFMSKAGARWMYLKSGIINPERLEQAKQAKAFFEKGANAACDRIVIENPVPLKIVGLPPPSQVIQPYDFNEPYSKATCLWVYGDLPLLIPTSMSIIHTPYLPSNTSQFAKGKGGSRGVVHNAKDASKTFWGVGRAMADQYVRYITNKDEYYGLHKM